MSVPRELQRAGSARAGPAVSTGSLFLLFGGINLINLVFHWPEILQFEHFTFGDPGSNLYLHEMIRSGLTPAVDFSFAYGLLSALLGDLWFGILGLHPYAYAAAAIFSCLAISHGLALHCRALEFGWFPAMALAALMPHAVTPSQASITHYLEGVAIVYGLALYAKGRTPEALGMATLGALIKPSLSYVLGAILIGAILWDLRRAGKLGDAAAWARQFRVAMAAAIAVIAVVVLRYGWQATVQTVFPVAGRAVYRARNNGFFTGVGREFWIPGGARIGYYFGTPAAFWIVASLCLLAGAIAMLAGAGKTRPEVLRTALAAAALHVVFVTMFFGNGWTWKYYSYLLVTGIGACMMRWPGTRFAALGLSVLAVVANYTDIRQTVAQWKASRPDTTKMGLWMTAEQRADWAYATELAAGGRVVALSVGGWPSLIDPRIQTPPRWFTEPGLINDRERRATGEAIRQADTVLIHDLPYAKPIRDLPEFFEELKPYRQVGDRKLFAVLVRR